MSKTTTVVVERGGEEFEVEVEYTCTCTEDTCTVTVERVYEGEPGAVIVREAAEYTAEELAVFTREAEKALRAEDEDRAAGAYQAQLERGWGWGY